MMNLIKVYNILLIDSPPMKLSDVRLQDHRPDVVIPSQGGDRRPDPHLQPEHRVNGGTKKKQNYPDQEPAAGSLSSYGIPGYSGPYDHFSSSYEPVGNHYGSVTTENFAGHGLEDEHGHVGKYSSKDFAMSFLAFLIVLSVLQGGLIALMKTDPVVGFYYNRRKREVEDPMELTNIPLVTLPPQISGRTWMFKDSREIQCIQHKVCVINRQLNRDLGNAGELLGQYLSHWVSTFVDAGWRRLVIDAGQAGQRDTDCSVLYRGCHDSKKSS